MGEPPAASGPPDLWVIIPKYGRVGGVPSQGMQGVVENPHQPPDSLCEIPHTVHYSDSGGS